MEQVDCKFVAEPLALDILLVEGLRRLRFVVAVETSFECSDVVVDSEQRPQSRGVSEEAEVVVRCEAVETSVSLGVYGMFSPDCLTWCPWA